VLGYTAREIKDHIVIAKEPAADASEVLKYAGNMDFLAAAILYKINIIICEPVSISTKKYRWQIYPPKAELHTVCRLCFENNILNFCR
jgi:hypothetical protein